MSVLPARTDAFDFFSPAMRVDPYPAYHRLRGTDPVHRDQHGVWITRHADAVAVLRGAAFGRDQERFAAAYRRTLGEGPAFEYVTRRMTYYGPPDHGRIRGRFAAAFTPRRIERLRPYVAGLAHRILDEVAGEDRVDLLAELAHPIPSLVICELLGVPDADRPAFDRWTQAIAHLISPSVTPDQLAEGTAALTEEWARVEELVGERRAAPGDDLLSALVHPEQGGPRLSHDELITNVIFLFSAGHQTTRDTLGNGLLALLGPGRPYDRLAVDPSLAEAAAEECLRYDPPVTLALQLALQDAEVAGVPVAAGELLYVLLGAANRDPARFPDPDRFWIDRPDNHPLAFSLGPHHCLGSALARLEVATVLRTLAGRLPDLELAADEVRWRDTAVFRGPRGLWVAPGTDRRPHRGQGGAA